MKDNRITIVIVLAVIVIFGVVGFVVIGGNRTASEATSELDGVEIADIDTPVPEATKIEDNKTAESEAETTVPVVENAVVPTVRVGLESTNPSTVNLASGELQLIEFFAFW